MLTRQVFDENLAALAAAKGEKVTPERIRVYWRILSEDLTDEQMIHATANLLRDSEFFPSIAAIRAAAGIRDILSLYRKAYNGKCVCGLEISYPASHRRGFCDVCWRGVKETHGFTDADEQTALGIGQDDKPPALPRSGRMERITKGDFDA